MGSFNKLCARENSSSSFRTWMYLVLSELSCESNMEFAIEKKAFKLFQNLIKELELLFILNITRNFPVVVKKFKEGFIFTLSHDFSPFN